MRLCGFRCEQKKLCFGASSEKKEKVFPLKSVSTKISFMAIVIVVKCSSD